MRSLQIESGWLTLVVVRHRPCPRVDLHHQTASISMCFSLCCKRLSVRFAELLKEKLKVRIVERGQHAARQLVVAGLTDGSLFVLLLERG